MLWFTAKFRSPFRELSESKTALFCSDQLFSDLGMLDTIIVEVLSILWQRYVLHSIKLCMPVNYFNSSYVTPDKLHVNLINLGFTSNVFILFYY